MKYLEYLEKLGVAESRKGKVSRASRVADSIAGSREGKVSRVSGIARVARAAGTRVARVAERRVASAAEV